MNSKFSRIFYPVMTVIVICLGLLSRKMTAYIPHVINMFLGDSLWALMIYLIIRTFFKRWSVKKVAAIGISFCFIVEFSQLYHANWIDMIRRTTLGGLILGYGFSWSDLGAYLIGIGFGILIDRLIRKYIR